MEKEDMFLQFIGPTYGNNLHGRTRKLAVFFGNVNISKFPADYSHQ